MSIGELINLYRDGDLELQPEFQRFFRWEPEQKSRWIESILLGIPLPSIFVSQRPDGVWDVIDGLQRLSTILELVGELKKEDGSRCQPLVLTRTKLLPSLAGKYWSSKVKGCSLSSEQQRFIKRAKLDMKIILRESHGSRKYELFQRLNTGGSALSDQEVRSCILLSISRDFYRWISQLSKIEEFRACLPLTERQTNEQYDLELAVRFIVLRRIPEGRLSEISELGEFLTDEAVSLALDGKFPYKTEANAFRKTFKLLNAALGDDRV